MKLLKEFKLLILGLIFLSKLLFSENYALLFGGSGEEGSLNVEHNQFEKNYSILSKNLQKKGWTIKQYFNGGDKKRALQKNDATNHAKGINFILTNASKGDQVFFSYMSHGKQRNSKTGEKTHQILFENGQFISLDILETIIATLTNRGVKVLVADFSCHSGYTQSLKALGACIISTSIEEYYAFGYDPDNNTDIFEKHFVDLPSGKISVQEQFQVARLKAIHDLNFPQISSLETPYFDLWEIFYLNDPVSSDRNDERYKAYTMRQRLQCPLRNSEFFNDIILSIQESNLTHKTTPNTQKHKELIELMIQNLQNYKELVKQLDSENFKISNLLVELSQKEIRYRTTLYSGSYDEKLKALKEKQDLLNSIENDSVSITYMQDEIENRAYEIIKLERQLYQLHQHEMNKNKRKNSCTEFYL